MLSDGCEKTLVSKFNYDEEEDMSPGWWPERDCIDAYKEWREQFPQDDSDIPKEKLNPEEPSPDPNRIPSE